MKTTKTCHSLAALSLLTLLLSGCSKDDITYVESDAKEETAINLDCADFNADIALLQTLTAELLSGSCILSVDGNTLSFDSGTSVTVTVRESYGFGYVNPAVGISGKYWVIDGRALETLFSEALPLFQCKDGSWYYSLDAGQTWSFHADAEAGTDIPVFTSLTDDGTEVVVTLGSGSSFSFDYVEED